MTDRKWSMLTPEQYAAVVAGIERGTVKLVGGTFKAIDGEEPVIEAETNIVVDPSDHELLRLLGVEP